MNPVDIGDFANAVKSSLLKYILSVILNMPQVAPIIKMPVVGYVATKIIEWILAAALGKAGLVAFIINTKVFTQDQAKDYLAALKKLEQAPDNIPDAEWEKLEDEANRAFTNLVRFTA